MIINAVKLVRTTDIPKYAWSRIAQFQNIEHTSEVIVQLHNLPHDQQKNAKRQAEQIKYCLAQAKEYFEAAYAVSLATRPVLLYYSAMSMALAEILLKQTGDSRLSILRQQHNCHGLQLVVRTNPKPEDVIKQAASSLSVKAQEDISGNPKGTFEVWRRSAREYPVGCYHTLMFPNGTTQTGFRLLLVPRDEPPPVLPKGGLTLLECLSELPYMGDLLHRLGTPLEMVRATLNIKQNDLTGIPQQTFIVHPADPTLLEKFGQLVKVHPAAVNSLVLTEMPSGYVIVEKNDPDTPRILSWPNSTCMTDKNVYFSCSNFNLGEFGFLYVALHICGNFARYYPDLWLKHIEKSSPLAMAVDEMCNHAFDRLPLTILSELVRVYHVMED